MCVKCIDLSPYLSSSFSRVQSIVLLRPSNISLVVVGSHAIMRKLAFRSMVLRVASFTPLSNVVASDTDGREGPMLS
jgi:hypothetical protein